MKRWYTHTFEHFRKLDARIYKNNIFNDVPIYFLIFVEVLLYNKGHKYGVHGPRYGH